MKKILFVLALFSSVFASQAQMDEIEDHSGYSANIMAGYQIKLIPEAPVQVYGFGFGLRYNFLAPKSWLSASIGVPAQIGIDFRASSFYGSVFTLMHEVPVMFDINIGLDATANGKDLPFGAFLGGGPAINYIYLNANGNSYHFPSFGPMLHAGIKWKYYGNITGLRVSYLLGIGGSSYTKNDFTFSDSNPSVLSFGVIYGF